MCPAKASSNGTSAYGLRMTDDQISVQTTGSRRATKAIPARNPPWALWASWFTRSSESDVAQFPGVVAADEGGLRVDRILRDLQQLPEQVGPPGPAIGRAGDGGIVLRVEGHFTHRDEPPPRANELPAGAIGQRTRVKAVAGVGERNGQPLAERSRRGSALARGGG